MSAEGDPVIRALRLALSLVLVAPLPSMAAVPATPPPPGCFVLDWDDGDICLFSAPAGSFAFGGVALSPGDNRDAEIAVQIRVQGTFHTLASCYDRQSGVPAVCEERYDAPIDGTITYVCQVFGTGGPKFHCADPPRLPLLSGI